MSVVCSSRELEGGKDCKHIFFISYELLAEAENKAKKKGKGVSLTKKRKNTQPRKKINLDYSEDDDALCMVCCEPFSNSRPNERLVQCVICKDWSHEEGTEMKQV